MKLNGSSNIQNVSVVDDIEDIFDQTVQVADEKQFADKQYDKYTGRFYNEGFREALSALQDQAEGGKVNSNDENILQKSFNYASSISRPVEWGL